MTDEDFVFSNDGVTLGGTLTRPAGDGLAPGVVLISGSGANDRDETACGHKPFAVIADYARAHGYAALRFDDRGVGASSGNPASTTFSDSVSDASAALLAMARMPGIDPARLALIGHSEGGLVAVAAAATPRLPVQGIVMLASPAEPIEHLLHRQARVISEEGGATQEQIAHERAMNAAVFEIARSGIATEAVLPQLTAIIGEFLETWPERPAWFFRRYGRGGSTDGGYRRGAGLPVSARSRARQTSARRGKANSCAVRKSRYASGGGAEPCGIRDEHNRQPATGTRRRRFLRR